MIGKIIDLKKKYPFDKLEFHFKKIEDLGYFVYPTEHSCQILLDNNLIIDADFHDDYHLNAAEAIEAFYFK